jgi:hypothetical protein
LTDDENGCWTNQNKKLSAQGGKDNRRYSTISELKIIWELKDKMTPHPYWNATE